MVNSQSDRDLKVNRMVAAILEYNSGELMGEPEAALLKRVGRRYA